MDRGERVSVPESTSTGSHADEAGPFKIVTYPFDRYEVKVQLTAANVFVGIVEIRVNKDFLSYAQKASSVGTHDVEQFYREEEQEGE